MPKTILNVLFFMFPSGNEPVRDFLLELSREDRRVIGIDLYTVQIGWPLGMPLVRKMGKGLWEVRHDVSAGIARTFFTVVDDNMVLLHAFVKKSDKTPKKVLELVMNRLTEVHRGG